MPDFDFIFFDFMLRLVLVARERELVEVPVPVERRSRLLPMLDPSFVVVVRVSVWVLMVPPRCMSRVSVPFCIVPVPVPFCIVPGLPGIEPVVVGEDWAEAATALKSELNQRGVKFR